MLKPGGMDVSPRCCMIDDRNEKLGAGKPEAILNVNYGMNSVNKEGTSEMNHYPALSKTKIAFIFMDCLRAALPHVKPVPFLYIRNDGHAGVFVEPCNGEPRIPRRSKDDYEITLLDFLSSLMFFNIPVLLEGPTGVGKTFLLSQMFNAIFGTSGYYYVRLERSLTGRSIMDPFLERTLVKKLPTTSIAKGRCSQYGGIFIDEPNRGDSQDTLQILDCKISLYGDDAELGLPIPGTGRMKHPFIAAAMNPNDARYTATEAVDGAVENRLLRVTYPATPDMKHQDIEAPVDYHEQFWTDFRRRTGLKGDWRVLYPAVTDPTLLSTRLPDDVLEFIELTTGFLVGEKSFAQNEMVASQLGFRFNFAFRDDDDFKMVKEVKNALGDAIFSNRDLMKLVNLTRAMALLRAYKKQLAEVVITIEDAAVAFVLLLENKRHHGNMRAMLIADIIREVTRTYRQIRKDSSLIDGFGLRAAIFQAAVNFGIGRGIAWMTKVIDSNIKRLNVSFTSIADASMRAQIIADLLSVRDFCTWKAHEMDAALKLPESNEVYHKLEEIYNKEGGLWTFDHLRLGPFFS